MDRILLTLLLGISQLANAGEFLVVEDVYLATYSYKNYFDPYLTTAVPEEKAIYGVDLGFNTHFYKSRDDGIYFNPKIQFLGTGRQVRRGGLIYEVGLRFHRVDFFYYHSSMHVMDIDGSPFHYPLDDHIGIRIHFKEVD